MKKLSIAWFIILIFAYSSFAKLAIVTLDEAIKENDLIIVGTLKDISERFEEDGTYGEGKIVIEKFIAGNLKTEDGRSLKSGDKLHLNYAETFSCVMGSHKRIENEKGIFLLKLDDAGNIQYEDFRSHDDLAEVKRLLKKEIKPNEGIKIIKLLKETKQVSQVSATENTISETPKVSFGVYSLERKINYQGISLLFVILLSISLYYLLYRSRFKIR